jgi:NitT/TauT family transport system substrate-binding protein
VRRPLISGRAAAGLRPARIAAGAALAALLLGGCSRPAGSAAPAPSAAGPGPAALPKLRVQMDWYPQPEQGGTYQAAARGFYREAGLDVTILSGGPGRAMVTGMLAGQDDIEMAESVDVISRVQRGLPIVMVAAVMEHDPVAVMVHADSPVKSLADLNGRTVMALPGTTWMSYVKMRYHIDFNLIPINFGIAQFMADPNFIQQCFITSEPFFAAKGGVKPRAILVSDSGYDPYRVYVTTRRFAREHPEEVRAFVAATIRGWNDLVSGDAGPAKRMIGALNPQMTPDFMDYSVATMVKYRLVTGDPSKGERAGLITRARVQQQIDLMLQLKILPAPVTVDQVASFDFLPPDLQALAR